jgi:RNA polymerase sigma-70 factor (ECF subfamily)
MTRYRKHVIGIAFGMVGDLDDAKDVAQLVFVKTARNLDSYDPSRKFSTWLHRITVNASIDYIRKRKRHAHEVLDDYAESLENFEASPASIYERKRLRRLILDAASTLKRKQRLAFVMRYLDDREVREISEILDMPETTVRWYIHRARLTLRRELRRRFPLDFKSDGGLVAGHISH